MRALLLQAFFSVRSERQLMEQMTYNMLFPWFIGLSMDAPVWDVTVFTKNRDRLLEGDIACGLPPIIASDIGRPSRPARTTNSGVPPTASQIGRLPFDPGIDARVPERRARSP